MVLERSGYLTHVPGLRLTKYSNLKRKTILVHALIGPLSACPGCPLATTLTWGRCLGIEIKTEVGTKGLVREATTASTVATRWISIDTFNPTILIFITR